MSNKKGEKKLTHKEKASIKFVGGCEPRFMREIKAKLGYKEPCTVEDKFADKKEEEEDGLEDRDDIRNMKEEERPQIVVLNETTDVSKEQLEKEIKEHEKKKIEEGRIIFKKPEKRELDNDNSTKVDAKKIKNDLATIKRLQNNNTKLLSFGEEED